MKRNYRLITTLSALVFLASCGGGSSSSGAPSASNKCSINNVAISSGSTATISKSSSNLSLNLIFNLTEPLTVEFISNFENVAANDWIEAYPLTANYVAGNQMVTLQYDLNSPSRTGTDTYSKLNITALLPGNEACVVNQAVNITLTP